MPESKPDVIVNIPGMGTVSLRALEESQRKYKASLYRSSLAEFVRASWHLVEPKSPLAWNWHLDEFCDLLEGIRPGDREIVNVPPGTSKSLLFSVFFNAWVWASDASKRFLTASYTIDLTLRDNRRLRDIVRSEWYTSHFGVRLSSDQNAKERFETSEKGWRIASSVEGVGTGEHPDYIIIDDPLKVQDARSETKRKAANDWIDGTISTRVRLDPAIIVVMQRLHEEDPSGHLLAKGGWNHTCFPMHYAVTPVKGDCRRVPDTRDHRTSQGELLWPEVWDEDKIANAELLLGLQASGQLEQLPLPEGGLLYSRDWFDIVEECPIDVDEVRGWDIAATDAEEKSASRANWTVGVKIARCRQTRMLYIKDVVSVQSTFVDDLILNTARVDGAACKIREGSGSGKATIKARAVLLQGYDYAPSPETSASGDKIQRNNPFRAQAQARNVKVVRGEWNERWLSVVCNFPLGKCDDDVDATSNAANELMGVVEEGIFSVTW